MSINCSENLNGEDWGSAYIGGKHGCPGRGHAQNVTPLCSAYKKAAVPAQRERPWPRSLTRLSTG